VTDTEAVRDEIHYTRGDGVDKIVGFQRGEDKLVLFGYTIDQVTRVATPDGMVLNLAGGGAILFEDVSAIAVRSDVIFG
jgi:hypothetical protein